MLFLALSHIKDVFLSVHPSLFMLMVARGSCRAVLHPNFHNQMRKRISKRFGFAGINVGLFNVSTIQTRTEIISVLVSETGTFPVKKQCHNIELLYIHSTSIIFRLESFEDTITYSP